MEDIFDPTPKSKVKLKAMQRMSTKVLFMKTDMTEHSPKEKEKNYNMEFDQATIRKLRA